MPLPKALIAGAAATVAVGYAAHQWMDAAERAKAQEEAERVERERSERYAWLCYVPNPHPQSHGALQRSAGLMPCQSREVTEMRGWTRAQGGRDGTAAGGEEGQGATSPMPLNARLGGATHQP
jgi:hypothetical protein